MRKYALQSIKCQYTLWRIVCNYTSDRIFSKRGSLLTGRHVAGAVTPEQVAAAMERTVQRVRQMSHRELVQSLKDAGILTAAGKLAASYR